MQTEEYLIEQIKNNNNEAFVLLFRKYYKDLVLFAGSFTIRKETCEDIVQETFLKLWRDRHLLIINTSLKSFLLQSVKNRCLDDLRHKKVRLNHTNYTKTHYLLENSLDTENYVLYSELQNKFSEVLKNMPEVLRIPFLMNRNKGLTYKDIAAKHGVSERTIEVRVSKALSFLRLHLKEFCGVLFIYFHFFC